MLRENREAYYQAALETVICHGIRHKIHAADIETTLTRRGIPFTSEQFEGVYKRFEKEVVAGKHKNADQNDPRGLPEPPLPLPVDSDHPAHSKLRRTLVLLSLPTTDDLRPVYFVVEGVRSIDASDEDEEYYYEEHSCLTNFIPVEAIVVSGDFDHHGLFTFVNGVWMTQEYVDAKAAGKEHEYLKTVFKEL